MNAYSALADDYYSNMNLNTEMALPNNRETVLGFLERIQRIPESRAGWQDADSVVILLSRFFLSGAPR